jgi:hypothetical protein
MLIIGDVKMGVSVPDTEENMKMCKCPGCPTFKGSPLSGGFFCAKGKAKETLSSQAASARHVQYSASTD